MSKKKARLTDNDPLQSKTDQILNSFSPSQQANKSTSQEVDQSESQPSQSTHSQNHRQPTKQVDQRGNQQVNKSGSQQVNKMTRQKVNKLTSQQATPTTDPPVQLKKATYQLSEQVIKQLDRAYLQMSLERGKQDTPYKEVLVEEAIAYFLDQLEQNPNLIEQALTRQEKRK